MILRLIWQVKHAKCSIIVTATAYVSDLNLKKGMNDVWTQWFDADHLPARATLGVADLGENVLLELVVTAVK